MWDLVSLVVSTSLIRSGGMEAVYIPSTNVICWNFGGMPPLLLHLVSGAIFPRDPYGSHPEDVPKDTENLAVLLGLKDNMVGDFILPSGLLSGCISSVSLFYCSGFFLCKVPRISWSQEFFNSM